ncbi:helix-turn-helix transcriptional regulator [Rubrimonas cliftonensis]|uniref:Helix-turn-helix domain-containing protein n=1 Tax=Rubrimonas cliftonensis TaxID=89524 RepID=A0A1H4FSF6_9RHOB|nr:helix-turn-helix transcriptional regulator [Rubrimonas cliftonensis]SEA99442.1 Helix-turn-helix domain-containing protein [Rubrimonas cliftonensis]
MALEQFEVTAAAPVLERASLADRVERFDFADRRRGVARWSVLRIGAVVISEIESTGHRICDSAEHGLTLFAPSVGALSITSGRSCLGGGAGEVLGFWTGRRESVVRAAEGGWFRGLGVRVATAPRHSGAPARLGDAAGARALFCFAREAMDAARGARGMFQRPRARAAAEALILDAVDALGEGMADSAVREDAIPSRRIRQAEEFIRANADEPLTVEAIAHAVGVGPRSLQAAFRRTLDTTPRAMLAGVRLQRVHALLADPAAQTTVTEVADACGFAHLGRFARVYRMRFGEAPSQTRRRALGRV